MSASNSPNTKNPSLIVLLFLLGFVVLIFLMRINRVAFFIMLALLLVVSLVVYLTRQIRQKKQAAAFARSSEGVIQAQMDTCQQHIQKLKTEAQEIHQNIKELQAQIQQSKNLKTNTRAESKKLIDAFENELKLRNVKIDFYEDCLKKLQNLLHNHSLLKELENKQQKLKQLQEARYEELADMESVRSNLEYEQTFLESIDTLSLRMLDSDSPDKAEALQLELDKLSQELRRL